MLQRERNRGRLAIRRVDCLEVTPSQAGFPGAHRAARLATRVRCNRTWCREIVELLGSLTLAEMQAQGLLPLQRGYWGSASRRHHCLDSTLGEDQSRGRNPRAARVLGTIRRVVVSLANAAVDRARRRNPKTKHHTRSFQQCFRRARGGRERLPALIYSMFSKAPDL